MTELDINIPKDGASGHAYGGFWVTHAQDPATATRSDAREAYYNPAKGRSNLHLITGKRVTRLITEDSCDDVKVTAVEVCMGLVYRTELLTLESPVRGFLWLQAYYCWR